MEIKTRDFAQALRTANIAIERRNTIPILSTVLVYSNAESATLRGTNLDQQMTIEVPTLNGKVVRACFDNPEALAALITAGGSETTTIDMEGSKASIVSGQMSGTINTHMVDDYPQMELSDMSSFDAELGEEAVDLLFRVAGAMSSEETRYYLNGVFFHHVEGWTYRFAATDGHRLYYANIELPAAVAGAVAHLKPQRGANSSGGVIIPRHVIEMLRRLRPHMGDAPLRFRLTNSLSGNKFEDLNPVVQKSYPTIVRLNMKAHGFPVELASKLIDGTFPDYSRVIPVQGANENQIVVKRTDLDRALRGITAGMGDKTKAVKLTFAKGKMVVSAKWIDAGFDGKIAIDASHMNGRGDFEIGYNGGYLRSLINAVGGDDLAITAADAAAPGTLVDPSATDFFAVLMPMRF